MEKARVWTEEVTIPTYETGAPEKLPMFIEKRVYQGSSGKVYPYPTIETICDEKRHKKYQAVFLENEYLKVMVLPELGGRIQRAYDKTNGYDFVYYNHVIKPALVGLLGPWISGGIEFNWPQHHRPTTYMPVDYQLLESEDGSCSVLLHDVDQMYGTKATTRISLYPDKAYIEITGRLYNRTSLPQTFLWWANPAVPVNEHTQSIFPPDVHAVMDHGKRDVSRFPIATGVYYKKDYSAGVDISRYKNIPVPTSYMAEKSEYDFVGGYDYEKQAGILHVADHHISPGKKQWTWGCGDFGRAWDRNLTDEDGPYVELMTGVYTDNQPDFTWLMPFEEKTFTQYFMPYKRLGQVKNASREAALTLKAEKDRVRFAVYGTTPRRVEIVLSCNGQHIFREEAEISPVELFEKEIPFSCPDETALKLSIYAEGEELLSYTPEKQGMHRIPDPAEAVGTPESIRTVEELFLAGQHIEQYRHATYLPDPYYLEALKRDPGDIRTNNAYGLLLLRRGLFAEAKGYFGRAIRRLTRRNPNPYDSEAYYNLGLAAFYTGAKKEACDAFYKATWSSAQQEMAFYYLAAMDAAEGNDAHGLEMAGKGLCKNYHNVKIRGLLAYLYRKLGRTEEARAQIAENLALDPFDFVSLWERECLEGRDPARAAGAMERSGQLYLMTARDYAEFGAYREALDVLETCPEEKRTPLLYYYMGYYAEKKGEGKEAVLKRIARAEAADPAGCFPNRLEDIPVLERAMELHGDGFACYYLGCLFYDRLQWEKSVDLWERAQKACPDFAAVYRNLAIAYYNKLHDGDRAQACMERAYALDESDVRIFLELDQLYKKRNVSWEDRLARYEAHRELPGKRDDLYTEYVTLCNMTGQYEKASDLIAAHTFHPWEGGEGKIAAQYTIALLEQARQALKEEDGKRAEVLLRQALVYPENLGEGKLEGTKDNHLYYHLGLALEMQGRKEEARDCFERASTGTDEPAGAMYYNDQPADMILYQGLALQKLGKQTEAKARFYRLIDYGERHIQDEAKVEYFAVSLPDFLIFDDDYTLKNRAHCCYLMALGNLGLGHVEEAKGFLKQALAAEPTHMMCHLYGKQL